MHAVQKLMAVQATALVASFHSFTMECSTLNAQKIRTRNHGVQPHQTMTLMACGGIVSVSCSLGTLGKIIGDVTTANEICI